MAWCAGPGRVMPGRLLRDLLQCDRVLGGHNNASVRAGLDLYSDVAGFSEGPQRCRALLS